MGALLGKTRDELLALSDEELEDWKHYVVNENYYYRDAQNDNLCFIAWLLHDLKVSLIQSIPFVESKIKHKDISTFIPSHPPGHKQIEPLQYAARTMPMAEYMVYRKRQYAAYSRGFAESIGAEHVRRSQKS